MTKEKLRIFILFGSLLGVLGLILLFFSVTFGMFLAESWLIGQVAADTPTYLIVMENYIHNFLVTGSILFSAGLAIFIFAFYKMLLAAESEEE